MAFSETNTSVDKAQQQAVPSTEALAEIDTETSDATVIAAIQKGLKALGFDPGPVDGKAGPKTRRAIEAFQSHSETTQDGKLSFELLAHINASLAPASKGEPRKPLHEPFIAEWLLGTWNVDCTGEEEGLKFERISYDQTWSEDWFVSLDDAGTFRICRKEPQFCYRYSRLTDDRIVYLGYESLGRNATYEIHVQKCPLTAAQSDSFSWSHSGVTKHENDPRGD